MEDDYLERVEVTASMLMASRGLIARASKCIEDASADELREALLDLADGYILLGTVDDNTMLKKLTGVEGLDLLTSALTLGVQRCKKQILDGLGAQE